MKKLVPLFLIALGISTAVTGQPYQGALTGKILLEEENHQQEFPEREITLQDFTYQGEMPGNGVFAATTNRPAVAMLSSAIIPGSGQAANGKWGRAIAYFLTDVAGVVYYVNRNNLARKREASYENYADRNWSVLAYAEWLVDYSAAHNLPNNYQDLEAELNLLSDSDRIPDFSNTTNDWAKVNLETIRAVENQTKYYFESGKISSGNFSHEVQDYGSQQYYELMSKYYQFQPGWQDFYEYYRNDPGHDYLYTWNTAMLTPNFIEGRDRAEEFNNNYRQAGNILKLMVVNHVLSAFDAYFTVKLKNSRIEMQANASQLNTVSVILHF